MNQKQLQTAFEAQCFMHEPIYEVWCDDCYSWVSHIKEFELQPGINWICCEACGNGVMKVTI